ncbi:pentapeptide repeat-containing protein [Nodosilinea sp. PGN35]|uniref:pentapeptide repeat-containing protein n=1 Tax=Nodosilinea sp. PGN35 TaxID=3020489 RepID=UPI0023B2511D|nr:pentapeptide repeat-containing protein [Nodosilinea sp. TSF1-S3]
MSWPRPNSFTKLVQSWGKPYHNLMRSLLIDAWAFEYWNTDSSTTTPARPMRWNIFVSLLVLFAAVTPTAWRVAREQLSRYQTLEAVADAATETVSTAQAVLSSPNRRCQRCEFAGANLSGQDLSRKNFREANMAGANLTRTQLINAVLHRANLTQATLHQVNLQGADLSEAILVQADLSQAQMLHVSLVKADLTNASLTQAELRDTALCSAQLQGADLSEASLYGAILRQADLANADLRGADLRYADLYEADLTNANLTGARLEFATMPDGSTYNQGYVQPVNPSHGCDSNPAESVADQPAT